eukprot:12896539-Alexandrium_andersonii.AAC.1
MAWHNGLEPPCELSGAAARPSPNHHRSNGNGSEASNRGDLVLRVLGDVHLPPPPKGRWPACPLTGPKEGKEF